MRRGCQERWGPEVAQVEAIGRPAPGPRIRTCFPFVKWEANASFQVCNIVVMS